MQKEVIAVADRNALLKKIGEISFTLDDLRLFLDTHPLDGNAIQLYQENITQRKQLLKQYVFGIQRKLKHLHQIPRPETLDLERWPCSMGSGGQRICCNKRRCLTNVEL